METVFHDLRFGLRVLLRNPLFTLVTVLSLALGIGANTTVFCWIQTILLDSLSGVAESERVVVITPVKGSSRYDTVSYPNWKDLGQLKEIFAGAIGSQITPVSLGVNGQFEWSYGQIVTANFFDVLGVKPMLGRTFLPEEGTKPGGHPVLVISEGLWDRRFGREAAILGRTVELNRRSFTIVGVVPKKFHGSMSGLIMDLWAPIMMHEEVAGFGSLGVRADNWMHTQARLCNGVSREKAQAAVTLLSKQLERTYPDSNKELGFELLPLWKAPYGGQSLFLPVLQLLLVVSLFVLLIVAANVANLLLSRAVARQKEVAIRMAVGAGRTRLIRQLLTESLLISFLGGIGGVVLTFWAKSLIFIFMPKSHLPIGYDFDINLKTLGFTLLLSLAVGFLFGMAPVWQSFRANLNDTLKEGTRGATAGSQSHRLRKVLVVSEVALALLMLVGAGLCYKGFEKSKKIDPGFNPKNVMGSALRISFHGYNHQTGEVFYRKLYDRLQMEPGVIAASMASFVPLGFERGPVTRVKVEGYQPQVNEDMSVPYSVIAPRYFETMRIPILDGRDFTLQDDTQNQRVVIINENMARRFWPGMNPIGRKLTVRGEHSVVVVGVVKSGKYYALDERARCYLYLPFLQGVPDLNLAVLMRGQGEAVSLAPVIRRAVQSVDPAVQLWTAVPVEEFIQAAWMPQRVASLLLIFLGMLSLLLAAMGIYAVMAYSVSQRTHEIGIRMALGAQSSDIFRLVIGQGMGWTLMGALIGLGGALVVTRLMANFLYGVSPMDATVFIGVTLLLFFVALAACFLPARRALRVDPMSTLHSE